ncbi:MAG: DNA repair protein RecO [Coriobacteriales bacterium]|nr:DNA repair protein RecO [Coriobacteriales bacterium]
MQRRVPQRRRGIVLDRTKLKEQDAILTMLAENGELVQAVAKGARKPGSRLAARTEIICDVDLVLSVGRGLAIVNEAQIVDAHADVRADLDKLSCASAVCEVARLTTYEDVEDRFLFAILSRTLTAVGEASDRNHLNLVLAAYVFKVLSHAGWRPELDACIACGEPSVSRFFVAGGGVICESCARDVAGARPISAQQLSWVAALVSSTFDTLVSCECDHSTASYLLHLAHEWAATHLEQRLRAYEFYVGL